MYTIRDAQLNALAEAAERVFLEEVVAYVLRVAPHAAHGLTDEEMRRRARAGLRRASRHGFSQRGPLKVFICLMFEVAPNFDEHPVIRAHLAAEPLDEGRRIRRLIVRVTDEQWAEAARQRDEEAWRG